MGDVQIVKGDSPVSHFDEDAVANYLEAQTYNKSRPLAFDTHSTIRSFMPIFLMNAIHKGVIEA